MTATSNGMISAQHISAAPAVQNGHVPVARTADRGAVRLGGQGPLFRASVADSGKVRLGGQGPLFR